MRLIFGISLAVLLTSAVSADVLLLQTGKRIEMESYSIENGTIHVQLNEHGEMAFPLEWVREIRSAPRPPFSLNVSETKVRPASAYSELVLAISKRHELDWKLVTAVMAAESNFDPDALSPKGAQGLMQLMPYTALLYGVQDPFDPEENVEAGVRHLKSLIGRYHGKLELALAAYNAGEKAVDDHRGIPPYDETRRYVKRVLRMYRGLSAST